MKKRKAMKLLRAVWISALAYATSFMLGLALAQFFKLDVVSEPGLVFQLIGLAVTAAIAYIFAMWYFTDAAAPSNGKEGFLFGIILFGTGFSLDFILILAWYANGGSLSEFLTYYQDPFFWSAVVLMIVTCYLVGKYKGVHPIKEKPLLQVQHKKLTKSKKKPKKKK